MANNETLIPIPGRLHSVATEGHVAGADEIIDDTLQKNQATINSEVNTALGTGGTVDQKIATALEDVAFIDGSSSSSAVVPSFDPESQTVHVTAQTLSEQQKAQVRENIGLGDVDAKINEAVASEASQRAAAVSGVQSSVNTETSRAQAAENTLNQKLSLLNGSEVIVVEDHTQVSSPDSQKVYREQGESSYTDWMYQNNEWKEIATYNPGIDDEPTVGSDNLVKSGSLAPIYNSFDYTEVHNYAEDMTWVATYAEDSYQVTKDDNDVIITHGASNVYLSFPLPLFESGKTIDIITAITGATSVYIMKSVTSESRGTLVQELSSNGGSFISAGKQYYLEVRGRWNVGRIQLADLVIKEHGATEQNVIKTNSLPDAVTFAAENYPTTKATVDKALQPTTSEVSVEISGNYWYALYDFKQGQKYKVSVSGKDISMYLSSSKSDDIGGRIIQIYNNTEFVCEYSNAVCITGYKTSIESTAIIYNLDSIYNELSQIQDITGSDGKITSLNNKYEFLNKMRQIAARYNGGEIKGTYPLVLAHFSDIHNSTENLARIISWCKQYDSFIDDIIHTGDSVEDKFTDGFDFWINTEGAGNILNIIGNHDVKTESSLTDKIGLPAYNQYLAPYILEWGVTQPSDASTEGKCYYYKDYATKGVRLIALDCMVQGATQLQWFTDILADAKTNNLSIIVAYHSAPYIPTSSDYIDCGFTSLQHKGNLAVYPWDDAISAVASFKSDGGKFICWIGGHSHHDSFLLKDNQPCILVDTAQFNQYDRDHVSVANERSRDCFNIIAFDTYRGLIKLLRVGSNIDNYFRRTDTMCYDYINNKVLFT